MDIPLGYTASSSTRVVCKLEQIFYRLKQSPRAWFGYFGLAMRKYGFQKNQLGSYFFFFKHQQGKIIVLIIYVDNMIIAGDDTKEISKLQKQLGTKFEMKNLGRLKYFIGI